MNSVTRMTDSPNMTLVVDCGHEAPIHAKKNKIMQILLKHSKLFQYVSKCYIVEPGGS